MLKSNIQLLTSNIQEEKEAWSVPSNEMYAFAVGRVRAMETKLLDSGKIERMVEAKSVDEALKVLGEGEYAEYLADLGSVHEYEKILKAEQRRIYLEMRTITPEPEIVGIFSRKFDYHNMKVLFKANKLAEKRDELLVPDVGTIPLSELVRSVNDEDFSNLPSRMRGAMEALAEQFRLEADPQLVDLLLDRALYEDILEIAGTLGSPFLEGYFTRLVDLINIKTYLRIRRMRLSKDFLKTALLPAGEVNMAKLVQLSDPMEVLVDRLAYSNYGSVVVEGVEAYLKTGTLIRYEKLADDFLIKYIKQAKYLTFGPEPIIGYLLAKENEIKMIRIIMVGKINQLPTEEIKERLRDVYV
jgi:V/A-type H+-transporting ATPase subunit C